MRHWSLVVIALSVLTLMAGAAVAKEPPRGKTGTPHALPRGLTPVAETSFVLAGEPDVRVAGDTVEILFETANPAPAARVYFGTFEPDQQWTTPRYRTAAQEKLDGFATSHHVVFDLAALKKPLIDVAGYGEKNAGTVPYRIEVYDAKRATAVFYDRVFGFANGRRVPAIERGPFLDCVTTHSAVVSWQTDLPARGTLLVGGVEHHAGEGRFFEVHLDNLESDREVSYQVRVLSEGASSLSRSYAFHTTPADAQKFTFVILGDSREGWGGGEDALGGTNYSTLTRFFYEAAEKGAAFIVHSGDLVNGYTTRREEFEMQLAAFKGAESVISHRIPIYEVMGNHEALIDGYDVPGVGVAFVDKDGENSAEATFARQFVNPVNGPEPKVTGAPTYKENAYYFDYGHLRIIVMNNNYWWSSMPERFGGNLEGYVMDDQYEWLVDLFEKSKDDPSVEHIILVSQEAMYPNGGHTEDGMWYSGGAPELNDGVDRRYVSYRRDQIWRAFTATGKALCGSFGDEHNYDRTWIGPEYDPQLTRGTWQIVSGGAGAPYYARNSDVPWARFVKVFTTQRNYSVFYVDGSRVEVVTYGFTGEELDRFVLSE